MAARKSTLRKCLVNECPNIVGDHGAHDYCPRHYGNFKRYGDPLESRGIPNGDAQLFLKEAAAYKGKGCLEWPYGRSNGYGVVQHNGQMHTASNVVCEIVHGPPPEGKPQAAHSCDNRGCVNPKHLSWSTSQGNLIDAVLRKRTNAKLTPDIVRAMRALDGTMPRRQIALRFGMSVTHTHRVLNNGAWAYLDREESR